MTQDLDEVCPQCEGKPTEFYVCSMCNGKGRIPTEKGIELLEFFELYGNYQEKK